MLRNGLPRPHIGMKNLRFFKPFKLPSKRSIGSLFTLVKEIDCETLTSRNRLSVSAFRRRRKRNRGKNNAGNADILMETVTVERTDLRPRLCVPPFVDDPPVQVQSGCL